MRRLSGILLPFLKLRQPSATRACQFQPGLGLRFLGPLIIWIVGIFLFCYNALTISAETFTPRREGHALEHRLLYPPSGIHMTYVLVVQRLLTIALTHYLCGDLMQAEEDLEHFRTADIHLMHDETGDPGVVHGLRGWFCRCCLRRSYQPRWLSSFFPDYVLLFLVGTCAVIYATMLWLRKLAPESPQSWIDRSDPGWLLSLDSFLFIYASILVIGFIYNTLELHVVANPSRRLEFRACLAFYMVLWFVNFLSILNDRYVFSSAWGHQGQWLFRVFAALAQVFVTHSTVMLGAVLLGHSEHLRRTPDLPCRAFCLKMLPSLTIVLLIAVYALESRVWHNHPQCSTSLENMIVNSWPWFQSLFPGLGGFFLLVAILLRDGAVENAEFYGMMDYDSVLMIFTISMAVIGNVNRILEMEAARRPLPFALACGELLCPLGLVTFAFNSWKRPPTNRNKFSLWFAFVLAAAMFTIFQELEDCEIASDLPECCNHPAVDHAFWRSRKDLVCNKDVRCLVEEDLFCDLGENLSKSKIQSWNISAKIEATEFDKETCQELEQRWIQYSKKDSEGFSRAVEEAENSERHLSSAFKLFRTIGQAASVEMYFTVLGVLLKVIFLTQHPNSADVLRLDGEHHREHRVESQSCLEMERRSSASLRAELS